MADQTAQRRGHEPRDVSVRVVTWFAAGLVVACVVIGFAVAGLYKLFERENPSPDAPSRVAFSAHMSAPEPRLQVWPAVDLDEFRAAEETKLNSYGWIDKPAGVIRIPIERAMNLIAERGLPTRGPGTQDASGKTPAQMRREKGVPTQP